MKIAVFGSTGGTGREVVKQALEQGYEVTAFVRSTPDFAQHERLRIVKGDVVTGQGVEVAVAGQDAVVIVLGASRTTKQPVVSEGTRTIVTAMQKLGVKRLVCQAAMQGDYRGIGRPSVISLAVGQIMNWMLKDTFADKRRQEEIVRASSLDWTIVQPPKLTNGPKTGVYQAAEKVMLPMMPSISRADVADFIVKQLVDKRMIGKVAALTY